ncbi:MAG: hypothetical protein JXN60_08440 [Lentisphaerae bacterium]|nr:hypothetical protein [Lentisphaerota bacterium]
MKHDVLAWAEGHPTKKLISKETLNHRGLIEMVSGLDVYQHTAEAYRRAYFALGIDIINRVPLENAPVPTPAGTTRPHPTRPYHLAPLGIYDTVSRHTYLCQTPQEVWTLDMNTANYQDLLVPVPHPCTTGDIQAREAAIDDVGLYYPMLYTTLFMWPVELLGWEVFMLAAISEKDRFHEHVLLPCAQKSKDIVAEMARASTNPFLYVHDDLALATGPFFRPAWYDAYIFPHYPDIWQAAKAGGKKIIFVADGNMTKFLPRLLEAGVDGIMFENPATPLEAVIEHFGQPGQFLIGGIETVTLTSGTPEDVRRMVFELYDQVQHLSGFALASCGGLHGNIPLENLEAYFDARVAIGATPKDWRGRGRGTVT